MGALLRDAEPGDVDQIVQMVGKFIGSSIYAEVLPFVPAIVGVLTERILEGGIVIVAEQDGRLVGMIAGYACAEPIAHQEELHELAWWVDPRYRSGSVGPKLLRSWEECGRQMGVAAIRMIAPAGQPGVARYYAKRGYRPVETTYMLRLDDGIGHRRTDRRGAPGGLAPGTREEEAGAAGDGAVPHSGTDPAGGGRGDESAGGCG